MKRVLPLKRKPVRANVKPEKPIISLSEPGYLRAAHVMALSGMAYSTLYSRIRKGVFPAPVKMGATSVWRTDVVRKALGL